jgi:methylenetetrahydrofolate dehydrogenase (NADP+)/methenyltetrahydrofolate cyclohydrolase
MMKLLDEAEAAVTGSRATVVGRSKVVGHPVAEMLLHRDATVTIAHSHTADLGAVTREADILMVAVGRPKIISADMVKPGATVIDAGINVTAQGIVGDVDFEACRAKAGAITPVPGGVGPVTNAMLLSAAVESAEQRVA